MIGRNELCPCGSGKKYKKCCLQKNQRTEFTRNKTLYAKGLYKNIENKICEYSTASSFQTNRKGCEERFYISKETNYIIDNLFNTYFIYDYLTENNNSIVKRFMDDNNLSLNKSQRSILSSIIKSSISMFKIEEIATTKAIIRDYFTDNKIIIEDVDLFNNFKNGESLIGRPINIQGMNILIGVCIKVSNENVKVILNNTEELYKKSNKKFANIKDFISDNNEILYKFAQQIILNDESYTVKPLSSKNANKAEVKEQKKEDINIYEILKNNIEEKYFQKGLDLWKEFIRSNNGIKGNENGWAAAVEYYIKKDAGETVTQVEVSKKYEISPRTLGKRYKELRAS